MAVLGSSTQAPVCGSLPGFVSGGVLGSKEQQTVVYVLTLLDSIVGIGLLILIFLHSGKDAGLSGAFGGGFQSIGGTGVVQKNLDRLTVGFAIVFFLLTVALGFLV